MGSPKGISIVEIIISAALIAIAISGIIAAVNVFLAISVKNTNQAQAALLLEETMEVLQYLRDDTWAGNFSNINTNSDYHLDWDGVNYSTTTVAVLVNGKFTRTFNFDPVNRDSNDDIVSVGGSSDPDTYLVNVLVSWQESDGPKSVSSEFLIHNVYQN